MPLNKSIAVLGCGWLGLPIAKELLTLGYNVKGSTTSDNRLNLLSNQGISPYIIQLGEHKVDGNISAFLEDVELLIMAFPPNLRRNPEHNFISKMLHLVSILQETSHLKQVIYVSSTSVFEEREAGSAGFRVITEATIPDGTSTKAKQLIEGERLLQHAENFTTTIVRFGGLIGDDRHPVKYLSGKTNVKNPNAPVNLIHKSDAISIIVSIIKQEKFGGVFHGVNPIHQPRKAYYQFKADTLNLEKPKFDEETTSVGKVIHSKRLHSDLNFKFESAL